MHKESYDKTFYSTNREGMLSSAGIVLNYVFDFYKPGSIIDVGCGQGAWLSRAEALGVKKLTGWDGDWVDEADLIPKNMKFRRVDLCQSALKIDLKHDLCVCLEVAEHLPESVADQFVTMLCGGSDVVLFSAAVPGQGGTKHINEQLQSYWIEKFLANHFDCFDVLRAALWDNNHVDSWYKQNLFLFVKRGATQIDTKRLKSLERPIYNIIYPGMLKYHAEAFASRWRAEQEPSLRFCLGCFKRWIFMTYKRIIRLAGMSS